MRQFGKLYNMNNQKRLETRTVLLEIASQVTCIVQHSSNGKEHIEAMVKRTIAGKNVVKQKNLQSF